jgi:tetratricopeptide (TPR) repeat protein
MKQEQQEKNKIENNYRYPGSRPFNDTALDRSLFFGRDEEKQRLFHHILVENLFVLFSRSGMGKTSLLNAGLMQMLRERDFLPMSIRFNDPEIKPLNTVYTGIEEAVQQRNEQVDDQNKIDYEPGETDSLWQFFKTAAFWIYDDVPLTPILIFDQFEEFFTLHAQKERAAFITQLADLFRGRVPRTLRKTLNSGSYGYFPYSNTTPKVKIVISIREDYLGHLEEMSKTIPGILKNRFRLLPLKCHRAKDAIIKPAQLSGDEYKHVRSKGFSYADETVREMLNFLCERREMGKIIKTEEVEPFQLQLLCRHIEEKVRQRSGRRPGVYKVWPGDLGGRTGMKKVLQGFYEDRLKVLSTPWKRRKVRKLCEKGLIFKKRRSLMDERRIIRKYKVSKELLSLLVDNRLLRSEPRVGSIFYELSHDTFVQPILESRRRRKLRQFWTGIPTAAIILTIIAYTGIIEPLKKGVDTFFNRQYVDALELKHQGKYDEAIEKYKTIVEKKKRYVSPYLEIAEIYEGKINKPGAAKEIYERAIYNGVKHAVIFYRLGKIYAGDENTWKKAIDNYEKAVRFNPGYISARANLAELKLLTGNYGEAYVMAKTILLVGNIEEVYRMATILLKNRSVSTVHKLVLRFISIASLIFQDKRTEAHRELDDFIRYYKTLSNYRHGDYTISKKFIKKSKELRDDEKKLLLDLIRILESPEKAGDEELEKLKTEYK